jgi:hypothetical protein
VREVINGIERAIHHLLMEAENITTTKKKREPAAS